MEAKHNTIEVNEAGLGAKPAKEFPEWLSLHGQGAGKTASIRLNFMW
jgi:hypothetical protein